METFKANAHPTKEFFLEMFTRDLSLEDCILDLIDNSIDEFIRSNNLDVSSIFNPTNIGEVGKEEKPYIEISISNSTFKIKDNCGGIPLDYALKEVFRFGHSSPISGSRLGVYGVGLKRAIFKIGNSIHIKSITDEDGFETKINVKEWSKMEEWTIPIWPVKLPKSHSNTGTIIEINELHSEVKMRISSGSFIGDLGRMIGQTYSLFLERYVHVYINDILIKPNEIPLGASGAVHPAKTTFTIELPEGKVDIKIIASLARRIEGQWRAIDAGWYILCNGRVVLFADKTSITGWGTGIPIFHSKYIGFIGVVNFYSENPHLLPWTTTKRGINRESEIYQETVNKMNIVSRPILSFLNNMYPSDIPEEIHERKIADEVESEDIRKISTGNDKQFSFDIPRTRKKITTVNVQYKADKGDIEKIKRAIRKPSYKATQVGKYTFDHFIKTECSE